MVATYTLLTLDKGTITGPAVPIWPPPPIIRVAPFDPGREEPTAKENFSTELLREAFAPVASFPHLTFSTNQPDQIENEGALIVVSVAHQVRFFREKDHHLHNIGAPTINAVDLSDLLEELGEDDKGSPMYSLSFHWRAGGTIFNTNHPRPVIISIDPTGHEAKLKYDDAAIGDDLYIVADHPLFQVEGSGTLDRIAGFRVEIGGFRPLDLASPNIRPYIEQVEAIVKKTRRNSMSLSSFASNVSKDRTLFEGELAGFLQLAFETTATSRNEVDRRTFVEFPAFYREAARWTIRETFGIASVDAPYVINLVKYAGLETELDNNSGMPAQCSTLRLLRDPVVATALRTARIVLPANEDNIERAVAIAKTLANSAKIDDGEWMARERNNAPLAGRFAAFRNRAPNEWTPYADCADLKAAVDEFELEIDLSVDDANRTTREPAPTLEDACAAFKAQLAAARSAGADPAQLDRLEARYRALKDAGMLDTRKTLPKLSRLLDALTVDLS